MELRRHLRIRAIFALIAAAHILAASFGVLVLLNAESTSAAQTIPYKINFQGRLTDNSGNILSDGSYNIRFRLFDDPSAGSSLWQANRTFGASDHRVVVQNGLFNIQFGDTTLGDPALSPTLFNTVTSGTLYLEVELPTPASATCATNGCAVWTEGPMTPRQALASSPYAFNADTVDGIDADAFGQLAAVQSWTDTNTFSKTGGAAIVLSGSAASGGSILQIGGALSGGSGSGTLFGANTTSGGDLINLQVSSALRLRVDNSGNLTSAGGLTATGDITLAQGAARTLSVAQASSGVGNDLNLTAGQSGTGANNGGNLILRAGATGGSGTAGSVIVRANGVDTTSAFQVQNAASAPAFTVDSVANKVVIGDATGTDADTSLLVIDTATADPATGYNGAMYYNSTSGTFRCYQAAAWKECGGTTITTEANTAASFVAGLANVAANATGVAVETLMFTAATTVSNTAGVTGFTAPADGSFRSCLIKNTANITAGTLGLRWRVNGASTGAAACPMNATTNRQSATSLDSGVVEFQAGDTIGIAFDTSAGFLPTGTNDFTAFWSVEYYSNGSGTPGGLSLQFVYDSSSAPALITLSNSKDLAVDAADTATDSSIVYDLQCTTCSANGGRFAVQNGGTDAFVVNPNNGGISLNQDVTIGNSSDLTVAGNISIGSGQQYQINGTQISSAALSNDSSITKQGNTFNGASQLVQLNGSTQLPAVSGALLTNLDPSDLAQGSASVTLQSAAATALTITANAASTWSTSAGNLTLQAGSGTISLGSTTTLSASGALTIDSGGTTALNLGNAAAAKTITLGNAASTALNLAAITVTIDSGTGGLNLGDTANTKTIDIGGVANSGTDTINIATNATAADSITLGNTNAATEITLVAGPNTTTSGTAGVVIGSATADAVQVNLQLDTNSNFTETGSTCTTTVNQGALYYNSTSTALRGCVNGTWEDVVSTAALGLQLFGVVTDSGPNPGDLAAQTFAAGTDSGGPCKVVQGSANLTIRWSSCIAYSGGRKVKVNAQTSDLATGLTVSGNFAWVCLTGANGQPAVVGNSATETANQPTFSAAAPTLCLAQVRRGATTIDRIFDTRTFTTTTKQIVNIVTTATTPGHVVTGNGTTTGQYLISTTAGTQNKIRGVVVATAGGTTANTMNAVIATAGPAFVKATAATVNDFVETSTTAGYARTTAATTNTTYGYIGMSIATVVNTCTNNTDTCRSSILTNVQLR